MSFFTIVRDGKEITYKEFIPKAPIKGPGLTKDIPKGRNFEIDTDTKKSYEPGQGIMAFSDGAWPKKGKVGCGFAIVNGEGRLLYSDGCKLPGYFKILEGELAGINMAARYLQEHINHLSSGQARPNITLYCDSTPALIQLRQGTNKSVLVEDTIRVLNELGESADLMLRHVRGHSEVKGNDLADEVAKFATAKEIDCGHLEYFARMGEQAQIIGMKRVKRLGKIVRVPKANRQNKRCL